MKRSVTTENKSEAVCGACGRKQAGRRVILETDVSVIVLCGDCNWALMLHSLSGSAVRHGSNAEKPKRKRKRKPRA